MKKRIIFLLGACGWCLGAFASGFGLYEMDAKSTAFGGHVYGRPFNASAVYYNPGAMQSLTGVWVSVSTTCLRPPLDTEVDGVKGSQMDPGWFTVPSAFVTAELPKGFHIGAGMFADFGLASKYRHTWPLAYDSTDSRFEGITFQPVVSYNITDKWCFGGGLRFTYVDFYTRQLHDYSALGVGHNWLKIKVNNRHDIGFGFTLGTSYRLTDDFSLGVLYRSRIKTKLSGEAQWKGAAVRGYHENEVSEDLRLPAQVTLGANWDNVLGVEGLHWGASASWIQWSNMGSLSFDVYNPMTQLIAPQTLDFKWHDTCRVGFGLGYDVTSSFEVLAGYTYDWDPSENKLGLAHTMLPPGDRHVLSVGIVWKSPSDAWEIALTYGGVIMQSLHSRYYDDFYAQNGVVHRYHSYNSYTHIVSAGVTYHF